MTEANRRTWYLAAVVALLLAMMGNVIHTIHGESLTWDEGDHIFAGYMGWKTHDFGLNPEHPPMVKELATLPLLGLPLAVPPLQGRFFKNEAYLDGRELLFRNGPANGGHYSAETLTFRVRMPTLIFPLAAALLVLLAGWEMFSPAAGLFALAVFCFEPNALAHSGLVTTDMAASATTLATVYLFWRWVRVPTWPRLLAVGLAGGLALAAKHSTVLLAPMLVVLALGELAGLWLSERHRPDAGRTLRRAALRLAGALVAITVMSVVVLWAFYGFRYNARPAGLALAPSLKEYVGPLAGVEARGILLAARPRVLPESWLYGLADVRAMANGTPSYFFGKVYLHGVWFYFPVLFFIKSTLGMMGLLALTAYAIARGWLRSAWLRGGRELWFIVTPPALYLAVAMDSHLNIGARHILPLWVFACVLAGAGAAALVRHDRRWTWAVALLLAMHVGSSLRAAPDYMAYANEAWGGPTQAYRYLTDSNTDWGQQMLATRAYLQRHNIHDCWIAYFVAPAILPEDYGIPCRRLETFDSIAFGDDIQVPTVIHGPVLISAGTLSGYETGSSVLNPFEGFRSVRPSAYIADGVFVYEGTFNVAFDSALAHMVASQGLMGRHDVQGALREASEAVAAAPGEVQPALQLGDMLAATGDNAGAAAAYRSALPRIAQMDEDARAQWTTTVELKLKAVCAVCKKP